jgi:hypothetical protein
MWGNIISGGDGDAAVQAETAYFKYEIGVSQRIGKVANNFSDLVWEW